MVDQIPVLVIHFLVLNCLARVFGHMSPPAPVRDLINKLRISSLNLRDRQLLFFLQGLLALKLVDKSLHFPLLIPFMDTNLVLHEAHEFLDFLLLFFLLDYFLEVRDFGLEGRLWVHVIEAVLGQLGT